MVSLIEQWLTDLSKKGRSSHTIAAYRRGLHHFIQWNEAAYQTTEFDPAQVIGRDVRDWKTHQQQHQQQTENAKPATVNQRLSALIQFFLHGAVAKDIFRKTLRLRLLVYPQLSENRRHCQTGTYAASCVRFTAAE